MRRAATLVEALVAGAIALVLLAALTSTWSSTRAAQDVAGRQLERVEGAVLALHRLRMDLRQLALVPGQQVLGHSLTIGPDHRSLRLRRSAPGFPGQRPGSAFTVVSYALEAAGKELFRLVRTETTASGVLLPGRGTTREDTALRGAVLRDFTALYREDEARDCRVIHVALAVAGSDGSAPGRPATTLVTSVFALQRPEAAFAGPLPLFAEPLPASLAATAELPPGPVLAPEAPDAGPLP